MYNAALLSVQQRRWLRASHIPSRFLGRQLNDLDDWQDQAVVRSAVDGWVDAVVSGRIVRADGQPSCGVGLLLIGDPGHGKTTLACVILQEIICRLHSSKVLGVDRLHSIAYFGAYPELLELAKSGFDDPIDALLVQRLFGRQAMSIPILVIDDLGKEHRTASGWSENWFDHLLRARFDRGLATIITSNIPLDSWEATYGTSMASFAHEALTPLMIVSGKGDRRK